jgi:hypothetical protein
MSFQKYKQSLMGRVLLGLYVLKCDLSSLCCIIRILRTNPTINWNLSMKLLTQNIGNHNTTHS